MRKVTSWYAENSLPTDEGFGMDVHVLWARSEFETEGKELSDEVTMVT